MVGKSALGNFLKPGGRSGGRHKTTILKFSSKFNLPSSNSNFNFTEIIFIAIENPSTSDIDQLETE